ncbi:MAG: protein kinase [Polyangiaceae bacterium]|nr:protein kinase [Polyangiaceae bacterium]
MRRDLQRRTDDNAPMELSPGAAFARYTVEAALGGGGMGHVYRAFDTQLHRRVALKILHDANAKGDAAATAILREARAAAALNHLHVVTVFEVSEFEGVPFMAMELVQGTSLRQLIGRGSISIGRKIKWLTQVADALAAAHEAGIVHLDVKPENVIVREDDLVKVLDFGIARRRSFDPEKWLPTNVPPSDLALLNTLTNGNGAIVGTPRYMAPEQIGGSALSSHTDQFAWGVVAFELFTGKSPWPPGDDLYSLFSNIVRAKPPDLRSYVPELPDEVVRVVERAMSKPREDRFPAMGDVVRSLRPFLAETSGLASSDLAFRPVASDEMPTLRADATAPTVDVASLPISLPVADKDRSTAETIDAISLPGVAKKAAAETLRAAENVAAPSVHHTGAPVTQPTGSQLTQRSGMPAEPANAAISNRRVLGLAAALCTLLLGVWFFTRDKSVAAPPGPPRLTSCTDAAERTFAAATRAQRSGNWQSARQLFQETTTIDPECAPAHARLVVIGYWTDPPSKTRDAMRLALDLKEKLPERDGELLHCYESVLWNTPPDKKAFSSCLVSLSDAHPGDAELAYIASDFAPTPAKMRELAERALSIDPHYSDAYQALAAALARENNEEGALNALAKCVEKNTTSMDCLAQRALLLRHLGRCSDLESTGRAWIARSSESTGAHYTLASALAALQKPKAAVEEALVTRWAHLAGSSDAGSEPLERTALSALFGDLAGARKQAVGVFDKAQGAADSDDRVDAALWLIELDLETGNVDQATTFAADLFQRKAAWDAASRHRGFNSKAALFEPTLLRVLGLKNGLVKSEHKEALSAWNTRMKDTATLHQEGIWVLGTALLANTPEQAEKALETMPPSITSETSWISELPGLITYAYAAKTLLLAGKTDLALPLLKRAVASCTSLEDPLLHTQATLWLGQALAKTGNLQEACAAFTSVQAQWPATSGSLTRQSAEEQIKALSCK